LGIFGGLNIPKLTGGGGNPLSEGWSSRAGGAFGLTFTSIGRSNFGCGIDLLFSSEGGRRNGMQAIDASSLNPLAPAGTYFYADFKNESILNYLELPVMAKYSYKINKKTGLFFEFGPYAGYLLNARQKTTGSSIVYADPAGSQPVSYNTQTGQPAEVPFDANTDIKDKINSFNFGLTGGAGLTQNAGPGDIILNVRGAYGLTNIQKNAQDGKNQAGYLLISLGYAVPL
jgi:hypothetical protein